jgi:hypothetical protein
MAVAGRPEKQDIGDWIERSAVRSILIQFFHVEPVVLTHDVVVRMSLKRSQHSQ